MKRPVTLAMILLVTVALFGAGCSKSTKEAKLQGAAAELEAQVQKLESSSKDLQEQMAKAALKAEEERRLAEDLLRAHQIRLMHSAADAFRVEPAGPTDNGWLILDGERTFTLTGHTGASKVRFYWADANGGLKPQLLGEDTVSTNGWAWKGVLPFGNMKAFWAEVHYPGGVIVNSSVLAIRNGGK